MDCMDLPLLPSLKMLFDHVQISQIIDASSFHFVYYIFILKLPYYFKMAQASFENIYLMT